MKRALPLMALVLALGGCSLEPKYVRPSPAISSSWPIGDPALKASEAELASLSYRDVFRDPVLVSIIERALSNNQDLRAAIANVEVARGLYRVQRAELLPAIEAGAGISRRDNGNGSQNGAGQGSTGGTTTSYTANVGTVAFEIDLFGRIRSLSNAALNSFFATEAAARATKLTLVADVADAYFTLAADRSLLEIARDTEANAVRSVKLTRARLEGGIAPRTDLRQAETVLAAAQSDVADLTTIVQQDRNALVLLVGSPLPDADLPKSLESIDGLVSPVPAGLDSGILLRRPDVVDAEFRLRSANGRIGAARAAFFPRISLTGLAGFASNALSSLFSDGSFTYQVAPALSLPIFDGGANSGNLASARAQTDVAVANYQKAIQSAYRDVSDALARRATIADQIAAQVKLEEVARDTVMLTDARYRGGIESFLTSLVAQRTLYTARRSLISTKLLRASNLVDLYRSIGGDPFAEMPPR